MNRTILVVSALVIFLVAFAQNPDNAVHKGNEYYRNGAYDLALLQYEQALRANAANYNAHYNLANVLFRQNKYVAAIEYTKKASNLGNGMQKSNAYYNEGVANSNLKNPEAAVESYKKTLRINPQDNEARENLQKALSELKKQQEQKQKQQQEQKKIHQK